MHEFYSLEVGLYLPKYAPIVKVWGYLSIYCQRARFPSVCTVAQLQELTVHV